MVDAGKPTMGEEKPVRTIYASVIPCGRVDLTKFYSGGPDIQARRRLAMPAAGPVRAG